MSDVERLERDLIRLGQAVGAMQDTMMDMLTLVLSLRAVAVSSGLVTDVKLDAMRDTCREIAAKRIAERNN